MNYKPTYDSWVVRHQVHMYILQLLESEKMHILASWYLAQARASRSAKAVIFHIDPSGYIDLVSFLDRLDYGKHTKNYGKWHIYRWFTY